MTLSIETQRRLVVEHIIDSALAQARLEGHVREVISDWVGNAIERAPHVAAWWSGKTAIHRLDETGTADGRGLGRPDRTPGIPGGWRAVETSLSTASGTSAPTRSPNEPAQEATHGGWLSNPEPATT